MTKSFVVMSALRGANANRYAVLLDVDVIEKRFVFFAQTN